MVRPGRNKEAEARFREALRAEGLRWTAERAAVLEAALSFPGHFGVDDLVKAVAHPGQSGSRATVYRALPLLVQAGVLQPAVVTGEERRFESAFGHAHHDHLVCRRCGKVVEFQFEAIEILQKAVAEQHGFELVGHLLELVGICADCRKSASAGDENESQH
jgi:Fur family ferric uptake transcriptional regulator